MLFISQNTSRLQVKLSNLSFKINILEKEEENKNKSRDS